MEKMEKLVIGRILIKISIIVILSILFYSCELSFVKVSNPSSDTIEESKSNHIFIKEFKLDDTSLFKTAWVENAAYLKYGKVVQLLEGERMIVITFDKRPKYVIKADTNLPVKNYGESNHKLFFNITDSTIIPQIIKLRLFDEISTEEILTYEFSTSNDD